MVDQNIFSELEMEAFMEMGNVGAGHAAIALTNLLNREVEMSVPYVREGDPSAILEHLSLKSGDLVAHEVIEVEEPIRYKLGLIFKPSTISTLLEILSTTRRNDITQASDLSEMQLSLIQEIGSVILLRYIAALNKMLKVESLPEEAPILSLIEAEESLNSIKYDDDTNSKLLLIQLDLFTDEKKFECNLFVQPHPDSVEDYRKAFFG